MHASSEAFVALPPGVALHARPAAALVRQALAFDAEVLVAAGTREADARSLLSLLALGASAGSTLRIRAQGPDAIDAIDRIVAEIRTLAE